MVKKAEVRKVVDKTFDACKSGGVKKLRISAAESYAGLSERMILKVTNKHTKYSKFNLHFMNKTILRPVKVSDVIQQVQMDLEDLSSQCVEYGGKRFRYVLSVMDVFSGFHWLYPLQRKFFRYVAEHLFKKSSKHGPPDGL